MEIIKIFPKILFTKEINLSLKEEKLLNNLILKENYRENSSMTEKPLSSINFEILKKKKLKSIKNKIINELNYYSNKIMKYQNNIKITNSWLTKTNINNYSHYHNHTNSFLSGVFYPNADNSTAEISFMNFNTSSFKGSLLEKNFDNSDLIFIKPIKNLLVIFPSEIYHRIEKQKNIKTRYSLAFNTLPIGEFGEADSKIIFK